MLTQAEFRGSLFLLGFKKYDQDDGMNDYAYSTYDEEGNLLKNIYVNIAFDHTFVEIRHGESYRFPKKLNHQKLLDEIMEYIA